MHVSLRLSSSYWMHAYHIGSKLISLDTCISCWIQAVHIDCISGVLQAERCCAHLVGAVVVLVEGYLHKIDAPFFLFRLHTIYIIVDAIQSKCNKNMLLLWKTCSAYYIHADCYIHLFLRLSSSFWMHAYHFESKLISLDTCISCWIQTVHIDCICGVLQAERMVVRTWWGRWWW